MSWFSSKVSLGNFPDFAGAVNKLQESVKNIEKNFDSALGFEEKPESSDESSGLWPASTDRKAVFDPVNTFVGHKSEENTGQLVEKHESSPEKATNEGSSEKMDSSDHAAKAEGEQVVEPDEAILTAAKQSSDDPENESVMVEKHVKHQDGANAATELTADCVKPDSDSRSVPVEGALESIVENIERLASVESPQKTEVSEAETSASPKSLQPKVLSDGDGEAESTILRPGELHNVSDINENANQQKILDKSDNDQTKQVEEKKENLTSVQLEASSDNNNANEIDHSSLPVPTEVADKAIQAYRTELSSTDPSNNAQDAACDSFSEETATEILKNEGDELVNFPEKETSDQWVSSGTKDSNSPDSQQELEKLKMEMKMMEAALQGAARQAQVKADEIAKLMNENEQLKTVIEDLKRKSNDTEIESLREEYHQRVATLERKVYALTKERDTLRREQNKKSDAAALLKEKDEIINQVMAEGEELSKKQAAQEATMRKLRAQIRELEEEKKGLTTKLQVEENKVESIKRDKMATEILLQETIEKHQSELATQKEYYTNALAAAKEAEALAEARANNEARTELEARLREAEERESMLIQALDELRQTLSRKEQQEVFKEDMFRRDIEDLQKRYQASERRCEELISQVPESTRPLLRQIEAMQETTARRAEAWAAIERNLNSRLQEAETKAATAEEKERSINERLSQTLSRINVLEAQLSCLRAEQSQLSKSLEKERQRAAENRQEYLAAKEEADTQEGRVSQLEQEIKELRRKHKQELHEALMQRELLQQELEKEKAARSDLEKAAHVHSNVLPDQTPLMKQSSTFENGNLTRKISNASSLGSVEESHFLLASLDSYDSFADRRNSGEPTMNPYYVKSMTPSAFEAALRQKEGELASYMSRLASMESIRDSLAEELVKMTEQCEKLRVEAAALPGLRAELEALRRRHSAALELMGERDEELEELRADIVDLKEMYREQVNLLVNKIQIMHPSSDAAS